MLRPIHASFPNLLRDLRGDYRRADLSMQCPERVILRDESNLAIITQEETL
jgi:hypothetical protein